ncbi:lytic transglycosylase domain-containing protein [Campylobacter geochelonis]|uniref:Putative signal recognition particle protein n=1 Tax=Campylobacter geochelonis TaxID=1780362 RepID=A0A128ELW7_9BACT|nr:lytic transglycosylase domain-containing protein [Campylobacter geochelonis]QKF71680.1 membrane-bound lytic murein transglycosylase D [Campylobacter geochelonis]CZE49253.1 putative signal recognition particle protein [Campylobacter geochelonis]
MKLFINFILTAVFAISSFASGSDSATNLVVEEILREFKIQDTQKNRDVINSINDNIKSNDIFDFKTIIESRPENVYIIKEELDKIDAPEFLLYLAMVESEFLNRATSHRKAGGMWQFMTGTAKTFGLKVDKHVDERRDPFASTDTAFKYIDFLNNKFDDKWYVSLMAYNCGDGCMRKVIRSAKTDDFSSILANKHTPRETRNFIKKIIKYTIISKRSDSRRVLANLKTDYKLQKIRVKGGTELASIATSIGLSADTMKKYNLHIKNSKVPNYKGGYHIYIPEDKLQLYALNYIGKEIRGARFINKDYRTHTVAKNDTLKSIADKWGVSVAGIKSENKLKGDKIAQNQKLKIPVESDVASVDMKKYIVKSGDTLTGLAKKFDVDINEIVATNDIKNRELMAGDTIVIP